MVPMESARQAGGMGKGRPRRARCSLQGEAGILHENDVARGVVQDAGHHAGVDTDAGWRQEIGRGIELGDHALGGIGVTVGDGDDDAGA